MGRVVALQDIESFPSTLYHKEPVDIHLSNPATLPLGPHSDSRSAARLRFTTRVPSVSAPTPGDARSLDPSELSADTGLSRPFIDYNQRCGAFKKKGDSAKHSTHLTVRLRRTRRLAPMSSHARSVPSAACLACGVRWVSPVRGLSAQPSSRDGRRRRAGRKATPPLVFLGHASCARHQFIVDGASLSPRDRPNLPSRVPHPFFDFVGAGVARSSHTAGCEARGDCGRDRSTAGGGRLRPRRPQWPSSA